MKKSLSVILSLLMILSTISFIPFNASAMDSSGKCGTLVNYTFDSETGALLIFGTGETKDYDRGDSPFYGNADIKSVSFGPMVKSIGKCLFEECTGLASVSIPGNVKTIGEQAFINCSGLESVELKSGVQTVGYYSFSTCDNLKSVVLPNTLTSIGVGAFRSNPNLESINIPDSVTSIGDYAFFNDEKLTISANCNHPLMSGVISSTPEVKWYMVHNWGEWTETKAYAAPTCVAAGSNAVYKRKCTNCTESETKGGETINPLGHDFESVVTPPTCTEDGYTTYNCKNCLYSYVDNEVPAAHTPGEPVTEITSPATYDKVGYCNIYVYCTVCTAELDRQEDVEIPMLEKTDLSKAEVSGIKNKTYTGKNTSQDITVTLNGKVLEKGKDYKVEGKNIAKIGTATLTIKGINAYSGKITKTYKINPKGTTLSKLTAKKKGFSAKWKKQTKQTTGYQIQYSTDKNFKKNNKTVTVSKNKTTSKTISKLKGKKKYYVRVRTYKKVGKTKYYSSWSKSKSVKTK